MCLSFSVQFCLSASLFRVLSRLLLHYLTYAPQLLASAAGGRGRLSLYDVGSGATISRGDLGFDATSLACGTTFLFIDSAV